MPRRRLLLHHHQTAYEPETLELPEEVVIPKKNAPSVNGTLRQTALRVPEVTWQCSGIMVQQMCGKLYDTTNRKDSFL